MISDLPVQSINIEELPDEEYNFVKTQQAIYNLCRAIESNSDLKSQIEQIQDVSSFLKIAAENGYEFTASDLEIAINLGLGNTSVSSDEFDDYELDEEELETIAGGTRRGATKNSYWHETGIQVEDQCFYLLNQSAEQRQIVIDALQNMEDWEWLGNNSVRLTDRDNQVNSFLISNITYNGAFKANVDTSDSSVWQVVL